MATNFCSNCGEAAVSTARFCSKCGTAYVAIAPVPVAPEPTQIPIMIKPAPVKQPVGVSGLQWVGIVIGLFVGGTALENAISMPSVAEYVTLNITPSTLIGGGWFHWYSGDYALLAQTSDPGGMSASTWRTILWFLTGFGFSLAGPGIKQGIRKSVREVSN